MIDKYNNQDSDKICMTQKQLDNITKPTPYINRKDTIIRDYRVVKDDLFVAKNTLSGTPLAKYFTVCLPV